MNFEEVLSYYWKYYLELESDFLRVSKYCSFEQGNKDAYSLEFLKLLQAACSEIDTLGKVVAQFVNPEFKIKDSSIKKWWFEIQDAALFAPDFWRRERVELGRVSVSHNGWRLMPWSGYRFEKAISKKGNEIFRLSEGAFSRKWWKAYTDVKHSRVSVNGEAVSPKFNLANLGNTIEAFAALYILERAFLTAVGTEDELQGFIDESRLFQPRAKKLTKRDIDRIFV